MTDTVTRDAPPAPPGDVTGSDIRTDVGPPSDGEDTPRARCARARSSVTERVFEFQAWLASCWLLVDRPPSLSDTWRAAGTVDARRVPAPKGSVLHRRLLAAWRWANRVERLAWLTVCVLGPTIAQGPVRWLMQRPSRRIGTYLAVAVAVAAFRSAFARHHGSHR